jgi:peptidoglycan/xylan/chitin deacetylase (PgdA/CDA1 family)
MNRGVLTISIDVELAWGWCDSPIGIAERRTISGERQVVRNILAIFNRYGIRATWAVIAHLIRHDCQFNGQLPHPEFPRPVQRNEKRDWFFQHPTTPADPLWYGPDIIEEIRTATPQQEIGSHGFAHIIYDEQATNRAAVVEDIRLAKDLHERHELPFASFVFPRNVVGFRDVLAHAGIHAFRGNTRRVYDRFPSPARRAANLLQFIAPLPAPVVLPSVDELGLVNVPDSMLLIGRGGLRRLISTRSLILKGTSALDAAAARKRVFHLWFHPSNFVSNTDKQFYVLQRLLEHATRLIRQGHIELLTMGEIARRVGH